MNVIKKKKKMAALKVELWFSLTKVEILAVWLHINCLELGNPNSFCIKIQPSLLPYKVLYYVCTTTTFFYKQMYVMYICFMMFASGE